MDPDFDPADDPTIAVSYRSAYSITRDRLEHPPGHRPSSFEGPARDFARELRVLRREAERLGDFGRARREAIDLGVADAEADLPPRR